MTTKASFADVKLDVNAGANPSERQAPATPEPETPFRILLLGDFSGRASKADKPAIRWKPVPVDRDNFEEVLTRLGVECPELSMGFRELEDFHPDRIYQRQRELFESPRDVRLERPAPPSEPQRPAAPA